MAKFGQKIHGLMSDTHMTVQFWGKIYIFRHSFRRNFCIFLFFNVDFFRKGACPQKRHTQNHGFDIIRKFMKFSITTFYFFRFFFILFLGQALFGFPGNIFNLSQLRGAVLGEFLWHKKNCAWKTAPCFPYFYSEHIIFLNTVGRDIVIFFLQTCKYVFFLFA